MKGNVPIPQLVKGEECWIVVAVQNVRLARAANGSAYYTAVASNSSGSIALRAWSEAISEWGELKPGLWGLVGKRNDYREQMQFDVTQYRPVPLAEYNKYHEGKPPKWARAWTFDIETIPLPEFRDRARFLVERDLRKGKLAPEECERYGSDPEAVVEARFRSGSLAAVTGRVLSIALEIAPIPEFDAGGEGRSLHLFGIREDGTEEPESAALSRFFAMVAERFDPETDEFVGHNLVAFDLPFVFQRGVHHKLKLPKVVDLRSYRVANVYDTMSEWWLGGRKTVSLDDLAWCLGLATSKSEEVDGGKVYDLFLEGRLAEIRDYNVADVRLTRQVYEVLVSTLGR